MSPPATPPPPQGSPGNCGWTMIGGKEHPCVVMALDPTTNALVVAHGSTVSHDDLGAFVKVDPSELPFALAFRGHGYRGLTETTYFYQRSVGAVVRLAKPTATRCPNGVWKKLKKLHGL